MRSLPVCSAVTLDLHGIKIVILLSLSTTTNTMSTCLAVSGRGPMNSMLISCQQSLGTGNGCSLPAWGPNGGLAALAWHTATDEGSYLVLHATPPEIPADQVQCALHTQVPCIG